MNTTRMRLKSVRMKDFKRFDDLTITLGDNPSKIIALVGPNGCGKSSVFDAFQQLSSNYLGGREHDSFYLKSMYSENQVSGNYQFEQSIFLTKEDGTPIINFNKKDFYVRSAYRFTPKLKVDTITALPNIMDDHNESKSSITIDNRMTRNYERLYGTLLQHFSDGDKTGTAIKNEYLEKINKILDGVLDVTISDLGNIQSGKGQLFFEKKGSKDFPYDNLSSGEKEVVDIIIDLIIKTQEFDETIYCIDEPELHLNTSIQRSLLIEIEKLIPDSCQLWIATHSIGFLRALQEELKDEISVLDFSETDYFNGVKEIKPIKPTRENWQRIFKTALEDLTGLLAPKCIIYCEGTLQRSLDESLFNMIFTEEYPNTMFISSSNKDSVQKYSAIALHVLNKAFSDVKIIALIDRDDSLTKPKNSTVTIKQLQRREFENYLFDKEVLIKYCATNEKQFSEDLYNTTIKDINNDDVEKMTNKIKNICNYIGDKEEFKLGLAKVIPQTSIYEILKNEIGLT